LSKLLTLVVLGPTQPSIPRDR